ncbi:hypothetical protein [Georgenia yuyongxinii]
MTRFVVDAGAVLDLAAAGAEVPGSSASSRGVALTQVQADALVTASADLAAAVADPVRVAPLAAVLDPAGKPPTTRPAIGAGGDPAAAGYATGWVAFAKSSGKPLKRSG